MTIENQGISNRSALEAYCSSVLSENPRLKNNLRVATSGELVEKLAVGIERRIVEFVSGHPEIAPRLKDIDTALKRGEFDEAVGVGEDIYRIIEPDAEFPLVGQVFNSMLINN